MFARKLGRLAGLVFVLVAVFGGVGAASASTTGADDGTTSTTTTAGPVQTTNTGLEWD